MYILHYDENGTPPGAKQWLASKVAGWARSQAEVQKLQDETARLRAQLAGGAS